MKTTSKGIVTTMLGIGCAWSNRGGLSSRKRDHENDKSSKINASRGSRFHQFRQSVKEGDTVNYHWFTLAVGELFVRETADDEWKAGIWYQIEAILSAALFAGDPDISPADYRDMQNRIGRSQRDKETPGETNEKLWLARFQWSCRYIAHPSGIF